ncbi:hypothetical protein CPJCM30710_27390 [Clostridium polyendosporum]|uniref:Uncharacterized protein n=1 Tax=Clostridium polyendosporum TaxID=69208 RepID=A0A919S2K0_9CLOT|nr:hypothetical protein CPJCM30710_27390 [Clostridium polyendosporum]
MSKNTYNFNIIPFTPVIVLFLISINAMDINSLKAYKVLISIIELYTNYMDNGKLSNIQDTYA